MSETTSTAPNPPAAPAAPAPRVDPLRPTSGPPGVVATAREKARTAAAAAPPPIAARPDPLSTPAAPAAPADAAAAATPAAAKKPEIDADAAALKTWARLQKENRELKAKLGAIEPDTAAAKTLADARKLYTEGKKMDAIALLAGAKDPSSEMEGLLAEYIAGGKDGAGDLTVADLAKQIAAKDAAEAKRREDEQKANDEKAAAAAADQARRDATAYVGSVIGELGAKYELSAKPENRARAAEEAFKGILVLREARGIDPKDMTPEKTRELIEEALVEIEVEFMLDAQREKVRGDLLGRVGKAPLQTQPPVAGSVPGQAAAPPQNGRREQPETRQPIAPTIDATHARPGVSQQPPQRFYTHEQARQRAREAARTGG